MTGGDPYRQGQEQIRLLHEEIGSLKQQVSDLTDENSQLEQEIKEIEESWGRKVAWEKGKRWFQKTITVILAFLASLPFLGGLGYLGYRWTTDPEGYTECYVKRCRRDKDNICLWAAIELGDDEEIWTVDDPNMAVTIAHDLGCKLITKD